MWSNFILKIKVWARNIHKIASSDIYTLRAYGANDPCNIDRRFAIRSSLQTDTPGLSTGLKPSFVPLDWLNEESKDVSIFVESSFVKALEVELSVEAYLLHDSTMALDIQSTKVLLVKYNDFSVNGANTSPDMEPMTLRNV
uniref:Uncharacterized protein n=1 Tax=Babesia bovis TaxID=5865 RepID=S6BHT3_BABBO|nr:hypothetical protein [Babesia bovis]